MWNVKSTETVKGQDDFASINRNIVECKVARTGISMAFTGVLIETLWNVKEGDSRVVTACDVVLIETLWNVKSVAFSL